MSGRVVLAVTAAPAYRLIAGQARALHTRGWDVHMVVGESVAASIHPHATVHVVPMRRDPAPVADAHALLGWTNLLRRLRPDVVVGSTPKAGLLSLSAAWAARVPHRVWWVWGLRSETGTGRVVAAAERATARVATATVASSQSLAQLLPSRLTMTPSVLGSGGVAGVDVRRFSPTPQSVESGVGPSPTASLGQPTAAFVGRLARDKGIAALAHAWPLVSTAVPGARLLLAGEEDRLDPPGAPLAQLTAQPGVTRLGQVGDVAAVMRQAQVLVLPSLREGMPAVVLEAAACGVPTVAWRATGTTDAVRDGVTGYLLPMGDIRGLSARLSELLLSPERAEAMGSAARSVAVTEFSTTRVEALFGDFLGSLIARSPGGTTAEPARHAWLPVGQP